MTKEQKGWFCTAVILQKCNCHGAFFGVTKDQENTYPHLSRSPELLQHFFSFQPPAETCISVFKEKNRKETSPDQLELRHPSEHLFLKALVALVSCEASIPITRWPIAWGFAGCCSVSISGFTTSAFIFSVVQVYSSFVNAILSILI